MQLPVSAWSSNLDLIRFIVLEINTAILIFCRFGLKLPIDAHFGGVLGACFPEIWSPIVLTPNGPSLRGNTSFEPYSVKIGPAIRSGRMIEKKGKDRTGQDRTVKKVTRW